jgi:hypothetical protein
MVFKRHPNVRDIVVKSDYPPEKRETFLDKVVRVISNVANVLNPVSRANAINMGQRFKIKGLITCMSTNVIYKLKCPCGLSYIGKTSGSFKTRISEHRSNIRTGETKHLVAAHFVPAGHPISSLRYIGIEMVKMSHRGGDTERKLLQKGIFLDPQVQHTCLLLAVTRSLNVQIVFYLKS